MNTGHSISTIAVALALALGLSSLALADGPAPNQALLVAAHDQELPETFGVWSFLLGEWNLQTKRYSFEGEVLEKESGDSTFSIAPGGGHILELEHTVVLGNAVQALHVFAAAPTSDTIEIARSDTAHHYHLSILTGTISGDRIELLEKHPNPDHDVLRRVIFIRESDDRFIRRLQFSTDGGETWFTRFESQYTRRQ